MTGTHVTEKGDGANRLNPKRRKAKQAQVFLTETLPEHRQVYHPSWDADLHGPLPRHLTPPPDGGSACKEISKQVTAVLGTMLSTKSDATAMRVVDFVRTIVAKPVCPGSLAALHESSLLIACVRGLLERHKCADVGDALLDTCAQLLHVALDAGIDPTVVRGEITRFMNGHTHSSCCRFAAVVGRALPVVVDVSVCRLLYFPNAKASSIRVMAQHKVDRQLVAALEKHIDNFSEQWLHTLSLYDLPTKHQMSPLTWPHNTVDSVDGPLAPCLDVVMLAFVDDKLAPVACRILLSLLATEAASKMATRDALMQRVTARVRGLTPTLELALLCYAYLGNDGTLRERMDKFVLNLNPAELQAWAPQTSLIAMRDLIVAARAVSVDEAALQSLLESSPLEKLGVLQCWLVFLEPAHGTTFWGTEGRILDTAARHNRSRVVLHTLPLRAYVSLLTDSTFGILASMICDVNSFLSNSNTWDLRFNHLMDVIAVANAAAVALGRLFSVLSWLPTSSCCVASSRYSCPSCWLDATLVDEAETAFSCLAMIARVARSAAVVAVCVDSWILIARYCPSLAESLPRASYGVCWILRQSVAHGLVAMHAEVLLRPGLGLDVMVIVWEMGCGPPPTLLLPNNISSTTVMGAIAAHCSLEPDASLLLYIFGQLVTTWCTNDDARHRTAVERQVALICRHSGISRSHLCDAFAVSICGVLMKDRLSSPIYRAFLVAIGVDSSLTRLALPAVVHSVIASDGHVERGPHVDMAAFCELLWRAGGVVKDATQLTPSRIVAVVAYLQHKLSLSGLRCRALKCLGALLQSQDTGVALSCDEVVLWTLATLRYAHDGNEEATRSAVLDTLEVLVSKLSDAAVLTHRHLIMAAMLQYIYTTSQLLKAPLEPFRVCYEGVKRAHALSESIARLRPTHVAAGVPLASFDLLVALVPTCEETVGLVMSALSPETFLGLVLELLQHDDWAVCAAGLQHLCQFLTTRRQAYASVVDQDGPVHVTVAAVIGRLLWLARVETRRDMQWLLARALGAMGAIEPQRLPCDVLDLSARSHSTDFAADLVRDLLYHRDFGVVAATISRLGTFSAKGILARDEVAGERRRVDPAASSPWTRLWIGRVVAKASKAMQAVATVCLPLLHRSPALTRSLLPHLVLDALEGNNRTVKNAIRSALDSVSNPSTDDDAWQLRTLQQLLHVLRAWSLPDAATSSKQKDAISNLLTSLGSKQLVSAACEVEDLAVSGNDDQQRRAVQDHDKLLRPIGVSAWKTEKQHAVSNPTSRCFVDDERLKTMAKLVDLSSASYASAYPLLLQLDRLEELDTTYCRSDVLAERERAFVHACKTTARNVVTRPRQFFSHRELATTSVLDVRHVLSSGAGDVHSTDLAADMTQLRLDGDANERDDDVPATTTPRPRSMNASVDSVDANGAAKTGLQRQAPLGPSSRAQRYHAWRPRNGPRQKPLKRSAPHAVVSACRKRQRVHEP